MNAPPCMWCRCSGRAHPTEPGAESFVDGLGDLSRFSRFGLSHELDLLTEGDGKHSATSVLIDREPMPGLRARGPRAHPPDRTSKATSRQRPEIDFRERSLSAGAHKSFRRPPMCMVLTIRTMMRSSATEGNCMETSISQFDDRQARSPLDEHSPASRPVRDGSTSPPVPASTVDAIDPDRSLNPSALPADSLDPNASDAPEGAAEASDRLRQPASDAPAADPSPVSEDDGLLKGLAKELGVLPPKGT